MFASPISFKWPLFVFPSPLGPYCPLCFPLWVLIVVEWFPVCLVSTLIQVSVVPSEYHAGVHLVNIPNSPPEMSKLSFWSRKMRHLLKLMQIFSLNFHLKFLEFFDNCFDEKLSFAYIVYVSEYSKNTINKSLFLFFWTNFRQKKCREIFFLEICCRVRIF